MRQSLELSEADTPPARQPKRKKFKITREEVCGTVLAAVPLIGFLIFSLAPLILAFAMAFLDMPGFEAVGGEWIGFANFTYVFSDPLFWQSVVTHLF